LSYGYRRSPTHVHQGVDLPAPEGTPLHAPWAGIVTHASAELEPGFSGYGGHVVIESPIGFWLFGHLSRVAVRPGDRIAQAQRIGDVGRTCYSTEDPSALCDGPHVHVELALTPYPQDSEAPRLDPANALEAVGGTELLFTGGLLRPPHGMTDPIVILFAAGLGFAAALAAAIAAAKDRR
jgi:murein DD-endopeptidase MepM/ murein hydrolase activator NlpD